MREDLAAMWAECPNVGGIVNSEECEKFGGQQGSRSSVCVDCDVGSG